MGGDITVDHDVHVHTFLSACSHDPEAVPENIIARAADHGIRTVGFADHVWDAAVPGASDWYRPQDFSHISRIREQLPADTRGVRVLVGCETEYVGGGRIGISPDVAEQLDFVLAPHSHFHMEGFVRPAEVNTPESIAELLQQRFAEVIELDVVTGIAHPFLPCGFPEWADEILGAIDDDRFSALFGRAAERGVSIEITVGAFPSINGTESEGWHNSAFLRVYDLALKAGCQFHFASDTHTLEGMGRVRELSPFMRQLGLRPENLHPISSRG